MDALLPILSGVGLLAAGAMAWIVARRFGLLGGLVLPVVAAGLALWASGRPMGHPEEAMGHGLAMLFLWLPLVVLTLAGAGLGLIARRRAARR